MIKDRSYQLDLICINRRLYFVAFYDPPTAAVFPRWIALILF